MKNHELLQKYFDRKKSSSKQFSLRLLAKKMDLSASFLSRVMNGQKPLPYPLLLKLADNLEIESEVLSILKDNYRAEELKKPQTQKREDVHTELEDWEMAEKASHKILRQWHYLPILDVTTLEGFDGTTASIAKRLGLEPQVAASAVSELLEMGLLEETESGLRKAHRKIRWGSSRSLDDIRAFHSQMLAKADELLKTATLPEDFERRLITGITVTASADKIESAKKKLNEVLHEIANDLAADQGTEVYQLAAQLFPLTKPSR